MLFVSEKAVFDNKKPIRGGVPIVFPCFGEWKFGPSHGFARISRWMLTQTGIADEGEVFAVFELEDNEETRAMWDGHKFGITYTIMLCKESLNFNIAIENRGAHPFEFTSLLHTYFRTSNASKVTVSGLNGLSFVDKVRGAIVDVESSEHVAIDQYIDRVYSGALSEHIITHLGASRDRLTRIHTFKYIYIYIYIYNVYIYVYMYVCIHCNVVFYSILNNIVNSVAVLLILSFNPLF